MLFTALQTVAETYPDNPALFEDNRSLTFKELWESCTRVAAQLQSLGVGEGDRVCILSPNSIDAVIAFWAIIQCKAISVYLNEQTPPDGIQQILDDAQPRLIVATAELAKKKIVTPGESILVHFQHLFALTTEQDDRETAEQASTANNPDSIASIIYTSGSTGKPKGVCLTHTNLISVAKMAGDEYRTTAEDTYLMIVPLHYIHGLMILMTMHLRGAGIHFMNNFMFPRLVTKKLQDTGVTGFSGVPFHIAALIERGGLLQAELPSLRWMGVTGGTCPPERLQQIRQHQSDIEIHISYGQTECSPRITALDHAKIDTKAGSVGEVAAGLTVEFLDENGKPVGVNQVGELVVSGPTVMHGYWNDIDNTNRVIDEQGRLHTGDLAYIDSEGDVFIKGRLQAMIKSAGERVFPEELETILNQSPDVIDVAVVGVPDKLYGQRIEAHVILARDNPETLETVRAFCLQQVPFARSPKKYHVWQDFPLKANGKTDKQRLLEWAE